ncbi:histidine kinase [Nonomuraea sp. MCN248]|uniref:Histidine kinase n=1 Tax=Nonomuraea corallina TaxID=2989783 RepID=A0ABT4S748_9ACTN|nr:histidine kinase [Nonomuraea corallina]MDA0633006.1 histidine kinase [Nonomuraea corallina]
MASRPDTARKILVYWMDGLVLLTGMILLIVILLSVRQGTIGWATGAASAVCMAVVFVLFSLILRDAFDSRPRPTVKLAVSGAAVVGIVLLRLPPGGDYMSWDVTAYFWLSVVVLYLPLWASALVGAALVTAVTFLNHTAGPDWPAVLPGQLVAAVSMSLAIWLWRWLWWTIRDAHDSQAAKARLAVAEERLRFARDLHDLLGHSLSVITLKSELAAKLAVKDSGKAAAEMADVRRLAGESLQEVRLAVDGYRSLDLDEELARARAVLEAAGTRCVVEARTAELTPDARALLAWVVREGATNVLKHSSASRCSITLAGGVLEMRNDGVHGAAGGAGSGLRGLAERMAAAGGAFSAGPVREGEFALRAEVPA